MITLTSILPDSISFFINIIIFVAGSIILFAFIIIGMAFIVFKRHKKQTRNYRRNGSYKLTQIVSPNSDQTMLLHERSIAFDEVPLSVYLPI